MDHYIEICIKSDKKTPTPVLASKVMEEIHKSLVQLKTKKIGVSFPRYGQTLGSIVRLHGGRDDLQDFNDAFEEKNDSKWSVGNIGVVPEGCGFASFYRVRPSKQLSKLRAGQKSGHYTKVKEYRISMAQEIIDLPFMMSLSASTGQAYKRFVGSKKAEGLVEGEFDSFGMSKTASVPVF